MKSIKPEFLPFDFSAIAAGATSEASMWSDSAGDFLVHGITTFNDAAGSTIPFDVEFFSYNGLLRLADAPMSDHAFEADARTPFKFPCPLLIPPNMRITCRLRNLSGTYTSSTTCTAQVVLYGEMVERGSFCPTKQPFIYSYHFNLSQPDDSSLFDSGSVPNAYNFLLGSGSGKPPLDWDYELTHISMDERTVNDDSALYYGLEIFDRKTRKGLFRVPCNEYLSCGTMISASLAAAASLSAPTGLPTNNTIAFELPRPLKFKKHSQVGVRLYQQPGLQPSASVNSMDQPGLNVLLMGNRILES